MAVRYNFQRVLPFRTAVPLTQRRKVSSANLAPRSQSQLIRAAGHEVIINGARARERRIPRRIMHLCRSFSFKKIIAPVERPGGEVDNGLFSKIRNFRAAHGNSDSEMIYRNVQFFKIIIWWLFQTIAGTLSQISGKLYTPRHCRSTRDHFGKLSHLWNLRDQRETRPKPRPTCCWWRRRGQSRPSSPLLFGRRSRRSPAARVLREIMPAVIKRGDIRVITVARAPANASITRGRWPRFNEAQLHKSLGVGDGRARSSSPRFPESRWNRVIRARSTDTREELLSSISSGECIVNFVLAKSVRQTCNFTVRRACRKRQIRVQSSPTRERPWKDSPREKCRGLRIYRPWRDNARNRSRGNCLDYSTESTRYTLYVGSVESAQFLRLNYRSPFLSPLVLSFRAHLGELVSRARFADRLIFAWMVARKKRRAIRWPEKRRLAILFAMRTYGAR